ncbi:HAMP domain-containing sensor histidine kinase [Roseofilum sp. BLCC_M91]|uniref:histidine kinase n=1 Tax=Roseofilum halophilum BLCC-M91 TaxID=3022259 RepID=A0ABT7BSN0_9CYAN|nr:HAMP domain-containing sensor histidine kinase [Roseofilum halophilum]MDJ1181298.1 HAMP domain-containing sensor histidine kinase [Roseofilum halophilum BLCC-M91]
MTSSASEASDGDESFSNAEILTVMAAIANATLYEELEMARVQTEETSRIKQQLLHKISHEFRTPLNGMIGFLKLILDGMADDPEDQMEFVQEAHNSALRLLNHIEDFLDLAKLQNNQMPVELSSVHLDELLRDVNKFTRSKAEKKGLTYSVSATETRDEIILLCNYPGLLQVMLNLVGNAIKFTHEGGVEIRAEAIPKKFDSLGREYPGSMRISISDTGIGVALDKQSKIFEAFYKVDGSHTARYEGTGIGLTISKGLIEAMGGQVNFFSLGEDLGSTVTLTIPLQQLPIIIKD